MPKYTLPKWAQDKSFEFKSAYLDYMRTARAADDRLRSLEALSEKSGYENIKTMAYKSAAQMIKQATGYEGDKPRFQRTPSSDISLKDLEKMTAEARRFMDMSTASKRQIDMITRQVAQTTSTGGKKDELGRPIKDLGGVKMTPELIRKMAHLGLWDQIKGQGSETVMRAIAQIQKNKRAIKAAARKGEEIKLVDDRFVNDKINEIVDNKSWLNAIMES